MPQDNSKRSTKTRDPRRLQGFEISGLFLRISRLTRGKRGRAFWDKNVVTPILPNINVGIRFMRIAAIGVAVERARPEARPEPDASDNNVPAGT